jgi:hypothetical protein
MKKILIFMVIAIAASSAAFGQMKADKSLETKLIAMEKKGWETWKNNESGYLQSLVSEDAMIVDETGVADKAQYMKNFFSSGCTVKSYSLSNFKFVMLAKDTAIMTYKAIQDAVCDGKQLPATQWTSSLYVKRGSKWENVFFQTSSIE